MICEKLCGKFMLNLYRYYISVIFELYKQEDYFTSLSLLRGLHEVNC